MPKRDLRVLKEEKMELPHRTGYGWRSSDRNGVLNTTLLNTSHIDRLDLQCTWHTCFLMHINVSALNTANLKWHRERRRVSSNGNKVDDICVLAKVGERMKTRRLQATLTRAWHIYVSISLKTRNGKERTLSLVEHSSHECSKSAKLSIQN